MIETLAALPAVPLSTFKPFLWFLLLIVGLWLGKQLITIIYKIRNP